MVKLNKNKKLSLILVAIVATACSVAPVHKTAADVIDDVMTEFTQLEKSSSGSGQDWFLLAQKARTSGNLDIAGLALNRAANLDFSAVRLGLEKARLDISGNDPAAAVTKLQAVSDGGFTSVDILLRDSVINSLAGREDYDALISAMSVQAYPCQRQPGFGEFDFWIGDWDVFLANGSAAGSNSIVREERGCVLVEHWVSATGGTGMSISYLDKITDEWVQIWHAEGGTQIDIRGGLTDDGMAMEGNIHYVGNGTTAPFRALWTALPDGRVRQYFEQSNDDGMTWDPWFEGFYTRKD